jgi:hypothetical protein
MTDTHDATDAMNLLIRGNAGHAPKHDDEQDDEQEQSVPSFDGGARGATPTPKGMNELIRRDAYR